ncbi:hypothetical protein CMI42_00130 [Candidatus Pacearchaeota archaeon]|nr:hypothetical protein [Candidatus Pacearchaeota archaeon]|tara:strand:+ start:1651 stop:1902 length:252 start_codon:yes stop_codon:yes gene_type:complete
MKEEVKIKEVNPTLKFLLSNNNVVINLLLLGFSFLLIIMIPIMALKDWLKEELVVDIILMIIGSFLGAGLLKYGLKKENGTAK